MNGHVSPAPLAFGSSRCGRDGATPLTEHRPETFLANLPETTPGDCMHRLHRLRSRRKTQEEGTNYWGAVECST